MGVLSLIFVITVLLFLGLKLASKAKLEEERKVSLASRLFVTSTIVTAQGIPASEDLPISVAMKVMFACTLLAGHVVNLFYSATLTSHLAAQKEFLPFSDDRSLYYQSNYKLVTVQGSGYVVNYQVNKNIDLWIQP